MTFRRRRYAFVGTGHRAQLYFDALLGAYADIAEPVALCDPNPARVAYYQRRRHEVSAAADALPAFGAGEYTAMLDEVGPDAVVVATVDATHADHVVAALERGVDVVVEKPLTVDAAGCARIVEAARRSTAEVVVTFNYRYAPRNSAVKRLLLDGAIGQVTAVHFEWVLDTVHGADYFRRWHRDKASSGGLFVHKATHHFDLVNWWLADAPATVSAHAGLRFYGPGSGRADTGAFAIDLASDPRLRALYVEAAEHDGYRRDRDVFSPGVTIEDTMAALVRYESGALLTYSLTAYAPWEGYRVAITGTEGRLELAVCERSSVRAGNAAEVVGADPVDRGGDRVRPAGTRLVVQRHWGQAEEVAIDESEAGHGGGDRRLLDDLFRPGSAPDPLGRAAGYLDGVRGVLVGAAANTSAARGGALVPVELPEESGR
ncbi:Gfo/Idh/MocA family oxidoreductase [Actinokineospora sp. 24-640]